MLTTLLIAGLAAVSFAPRPELPVLPGTSPVQETFCITTSVEAGAMSVCDESLREPIETMMQSGRADKKVILSDVDAECGCRICYEVCWGGTATVCYTYCTCTTGGYYGPGC